MKTIRLRKDITLIPGINMMLATGDDGKLRIPCDDITSIFGRLAPAISTGIEEDAVLGLFPANETEKVSGILKLLSERGFLVSSANGANAAVKPRPKSPSVTFVGHATLLIETCGRRILTDPWIFPHNRLIDRSPYPITFSELPPIDLISVSHRHNDHMNLPTLIRLDKKIPVIAPRIEEPGEYNKPLDGTLKVTGFERVIPLGVWESFELGEIRITRTPCHKAWSIMEQATWLIQSPEITIFCGGDMIEDESSMRRLGENYEIDLAFLPISGFSLEIGKTILKDRMPPDTHSRMLRDVMGINEAVESTKWIKPRFAVGYANGGAYWYRHPECSVLDEPSQKFVKLLEAANPDVKGINMHAGDVWEHKTGMLIRADDRPQ